MKSSIMFFVVVSRPVTLLSFFLFEDDSLFPFVFPFDDGFVVVVFVRRGGAIVVPFFFPYRGIAFPNVSGGDLSSPTIFATAGLAMVPSPS